MNGYCFKTLMAKRKVDSPFVIVVSIVNGIKYFYHGADLYEQGCSSCQQQSDEYEYEKD